LQAYIRITLYLYYEYSTVTVVPTHHSLRLIISVPLKTFIDTIHCSGLSLSPFRVAELNKHVQMIAEYQYLVLGDSRQRFLLWMEADLTKYRGQNFAIMPRRYSRA
jgi:hypothetical protein